MIMNTNYNFKVITELVCLTVLILLGTGINMSKAGSMMNEKKSAMDTSDIKYKRFLEGVTFFASGDEPYWSMEISKDKFIRFKVLEGLDLNMKYVNSEKAMDANIRRYRTDSDSGIFTATLSQSECMNDMSGEISPYTVTVELNDPGEKNYRKFKGCGYFVPDFALNRTWTISKIGDKQVTASEFQTKPTTLIFNVSDGTYNGFAGCNGYSGTLFMEDDNLHFNYPLSTMLYCPDMEKEKALFDAFAKATTYRISGNELTLISPDGQLLSFHGEQTKGQSDVKTSGAYRLTDIWVLENINGNMAEASNYMNGLPMLEINIGEKKFTGSGGCNRLNGVVEADDTAIKFSSIGSTRMMCPGNFEPEFLEALKSAETYSIGNNLLTLTSGGKEILKFRKID